MPPMAHWPSARARTRSGRSKSAKGRRPLRTPPHGEGLAIIQSPGSDPTTTHLFSESLRRAFDRVREPPKTTPASSPADEGRPPIEPQELPRKLEQLARSP